MPRETREERHLRRLERIEKGAEAIPGPVPNGSSSRGEYLSRSRGRSRGPSLGQAHPPSPQASDLLKKVRRRRRRRGQTSDEETSEAHPSEEETSFVRRTSSRTRTPSTITQPFSDHESQEDSDEDQNESSDPYDSEQDPEGGSDDNEETTPRQKNRVRRGQNPPFTVRTSLRLRHPSTPSGSSREVRLSQLTPPQGRATSRSHRTTSQQSTPSPGYAVRTSKRPRRSPYSTD